MSNKRKKVEEEKPASLVDSTNDESDEKEENGEKNNEAQKNSADGLVAHAQSIIDEMDEKRKNDQTIVAEFRKSMEEQTDHYCGMLESSLAKLYQTNNTRCQQKLQQLYAILARINKLEHEMASFKQSLSSLYDEVQTT